MKLTISLPLACLLAWPLISAHAADAHVHGAARLDVAVEGRSLTIVLDSPLDNLLGFERAPRTAAERSRADAVVAALKAGKPFRIDPRAECRLANVDLASPALKLGAAQTSTADHADLTGSFEYECADASKAAYLEVDLYGHPHMQRIDVQVAGSAGQFKRRLVKPAKRIQLVR